MNIYLVKNGEQTGPFTWGEVFVMLSKDELTLEDLGRIEPDGELLRLKEFGQWGEGDEVGPFTWEDIAAMLREGVLDTEVQARFEGDASYAQLAEVIEKSDEIERVPQESRISAFSEWLCKIPLSVRDKVARQRVRWALVAILLFFLGIGIALLEKRHKPPLEGPSVASEPTTEPSSKSAPAQTAENLAVMAAAQSSTSSPLETVPENPPSLPREPLPPTPAIAKAEAAPAREISDLQPAPPEPATPQLPKPEPAPLAQPASPLAKATPVPPNPKPTPKNVQTVSVSDFFKLESIKLVRKAPKDSIAVWEVPTVNGKPGEPIFHPALEVKVSARENIRSDKTFARAYFFGPDDKIVSSLKVPSKAGRPRRAEHSMPVLFFKEKPESLFFEIPKELGNSQWKAAVVFGDKDEAQVITYPTTSSPFLLDYPEKELVTRKGTARVARKPAMDPLIEHVVKTRNPKMPQMTLFLRPPRNVSDSSEIRGVMALCLLAGSVEDIRRELQKEEMSGDHHGLLAFADKNKLAILAWGSNSALWARANYDQLTRQQAREYEASFGIVANAWERGVLELGEKYGMPTKNFLIQGQCGSAHLAKALCLAKPQYFLAIHIHIPGFFEKPTPEASRVLWCITTGELYGTYDYSLRFLKDAKALGYPILYKAFVGLGHSGHPDATAMGLEFFKFALTQQELIEEHEKKKSSAIDSFALSSVENSGPWLEAFSTPPLYGDIINQEVFPADQVEMIPEGFRIAIPTKELGSIWKKNR